MNASLANTTEGAGPLTERDPGRLHITRRQIAFALVLAILGVIAAIYTIDSVKSGEASYPAVVTSSKTYDLNFANTGEVTSIAVKVGQPVRAGQLLATQQSSALRTQVLTDEGVVKADQAALAQANAPQITPAQREQDSLQLAQAQTALTNAQAGLTAAEASGKASVAAAQATASSDQVLTNSDSTRYTTACPGGPVAPASTLSGPALQTAQAQYSMCQTLQQQYDKDLAASGEAQAQVPLAEAQAQQAINSAQATVNTAQAAVNTANYQQTLQTSPTDVAGQAQAEANLNQAEGQLAQAQQALQEASIVAPGNGVVAEVYGAVGEYLGADGVHMYQAPPALSGKQPSGFSLFPAQPAESGSSSTNTGAEPLIEVVGGFQQIMAQVPESDVSKLPVGHKATVSVSALHTSATGTVTDVVLNPTRDNSAVTYDVIITLSRTVPGLLPGMSATVRT
jgi:multidrug efflux pump subunit AcrA (membrane-fusion protein)